MTTPHQTKESGFLRVKFAAEADGLFEGYGSVAGNIDQGGDIVLPGAFTASVARHKAAGTMPVMLWMHDPGKPIGRWLDVKEDDVGLFVRGQLNLKTAAGREAHAHIAEGDVTGLSIGYRIPPGGSETKGGVHRIRTASLEEVSVVTLPMNERARIHLASKGDLEDLLTKSGLSKQAAKRVAFGGWQALQPPSDSDQLARLVEAVNDSIRLFKGL